MIKDFWTIVFIFFYFQNVSARMSFSLLQVFVELGNLRGIYNCYAMCLTGQFRVNFGDL